VSTLIDCIVLGSRVISPKSTSRSGMAAFSPVHPGSATGPPIFGMRTGFAESDTRGREARNLDSASSSLTYPPNLLCGQLGLGGGVYGHANGSYSDGGIAPLRVGAEREGSRRDCPRMVGPLWWYLSFVALTRATHERSLLGVMQQLENWLSHDI
jgi:hypothetical protein